MIEDEIVGLEGWRWCPRMRVFSKEKGRHPPGTILCTTQYSNYEVYVTLLDEYGEEHEVRGDSLRPDLKDPATLGCIEFGLLPQLYGCEVSVVLEEGLWVIACHNGIKPSLTKTVRSCSNKAEALFIALENGPLPVPKVPQPKPEILKGTVVLYHPRTGRGEVLLEDGRAITFGASCFESGIPGRPPCPPDRVRVRLTESGVLYVRLRSSLDLLWERLEFVVEAQPSLADSEHWSHLKMAKDIFGWDSPAVLGYLAALVREAYANPTLTASFKPSPSSATRGSTCGSPTRSWAIVNGPVVVKGVIFESPREFDAWLAALEAKFSE